MTHDELLSKIDDSTNGLKHEDIFPLLIANTQALRAVVELHKPYESTNAGLICEFCVENDSRDHRYPCPTIQAIEKELS